MLFAVSRCKFNNTQMIRQINGNHVAICGYHNFEFYENQAALNLTY